ncbi:MAG: hypothetical protein A2428_01865 [Bdellovibrionales bacterium RIFOXYC1_FULL_54_43]|nr:MAG: hypothetical protein A2428_01865 [Bdellovibrionales bacterium RIFOXYC1_FULL_54_43]OFZ81686.1 MAG: hypothetical protein A2603_12075 [Bdellovibrionales bacterium RIFOXYD1_FULL_55_31]
MDQNTAIAIEQPILLIDDEAEFLRVIAAQLQRLLGLRTIDCTDPRHALDLFRKHKPFLVISDLRMPYFSGLELCKQFKAEDRSTPFVLLTAFVDQKAAITGVETNVDGIINKPIEFQDLERVVRKFATARLKAVDAEKREMEEILAAFIQESTELLGDADQLILRLESLPLDPVIVDLLFRKLHSIKGAAGNFSGGVSLGKVAHQLESSLSGLKKGVITASPELIDLQLKSVDIIRSLLQCLGDKCAPSAELSSQTDEIIRALQAIMSPDMHAEPHEATAQHASISKSEEIRDSKDPKDAKDEGILVPHEKLDCLMELSGELIVLKNNFQAIAKEFGSGGGRSIEKKVTDFSTSLLKITDRIQEEMMSVRRIALGRALSKAPRLVRQTAQELKKKVTLATSGLDLPVDKNIAKAVSMASTHLLRNAIDHGLESPSDRLRAGKPEIGQIQIKAWQEQGVIHVEFSDNGRGISKSKVLSTAVSKGLLQHEQANALSDDEALQLILLPGFSTSATVSSVSGRGVGMDVVKTSVESLNGTLRILTREGQGTTFKLEFPIPKTVIVEQTVVVSSGSYFLAVPMPAIAKIIPLTSTERENLLARRYTKFGPSILPALPCNELFGLPITKSRGGKSHLIVLRCARASIGTIVDGVHSRLEAVVRPFGRIPGRPLGFKGTTMLDDDKLAYVISPDEITYESKPSSSHELNPAC